MKKIKIYTTPICFECEKAKNYFQKLGLKYEEIDATEKKEEAQKAFEKTGHKRIPIIEIGNNILSGFDKKKIEEFLK